MPTFHAYLVNTRWMVASCLAISCPERWLYLQLLETLSPYVLLAFVVTDGDPALLCALKGQVVLGFHKVGRRYLPLCIYIPL